MPKAKFKSTISTRRGAKKARMEAPQSTFLPEQVPTSASASVAQTTPAANVPVTAQVVEPPSLGLSSTSQTAIPINTVTQSQATMVPEMNYTISRAETSGSKDTVDSGTASGLNANRIGNPQNNLLSWFTNRKIAAKKSSDSKEWHQSLTQDLRKHHVYLISKAIFPSHINPAFLEDERMNNLVAYARKVEGDMHDTANSREEYYDLLAERIHKIQKYLEERRLNRIQQSTGGAVNMPGARQRLIGIPIHVIVRGDNSVKNFIEKLKRGKTTMYHASGMIIGCAGSGKTTLLERLKGIDVNEIKKNISSTRGVDIHTDVFDVTESILVNFSSQEQRFKLRLEAEDMKHLESVADDLEKMVPVDDKGNKVEASNSGHLSHGYTDVKTTLSYKPGGANAVKKNINESKDFPYSSEFSGKLKIEEKGNSDPDKKITMVDFAGQCAYYASHQIFLSPRAFFILVLNMEKKFDDQVGEEVCCQEDSIYGGWTHRDYLEFWMKSIHQYGSDKAPVILVGTHCENKTEKEKALFFREVWKTLKKTSLQKHIDVKRRFAVGFLDNESVEKLKLSIADVVCRLDHWGEELPQSWAMFETFFREKKIHKILSRGELESFNETLPEGIKLQTTEDIDSMLQFFNDIRDIIHFNQQFLNESIILDVQWFADAFKNVITDKNHAKEDLFEFASEWDKFNETGELDETLLSAIWRMNNNGYIEHKEDILLYMEKLGLLAKMNDKKWYVPCMNKLQFPVDCFSSYPASSILCYAFGLLPAGIFHRLVATCMQIPWEIFSDGDRGCIYQTAAIFEFDDQHHIIMLGMTQTDIQLQVFVLEGKVDVTVCHQIREKIESILQDLSNTLENNIKFHVAFKCKPVGFCDSKDSAVVDESKFTRSTFNCPSCPAVEKHVINSKAITKYWKQVLNGQ
ncbi:uncharacterized protein LOC134250361 [Saccostrea cucullata]|uniref:uncharacterized protein LOC134250361 n=1 Tax=Saccostrea cuccullata TaxID=36930 RepID=UPI002ED5F55B